MPFSSFLFLLIWLADLFSSPREKVTVFVVSSCKTGTGGWYFDNIRPPPGVMDGGVIQLIESHGE